jgi:hypothetical protein
LISWANAVATSSAVVVDEKAVTVDIVVLTARVNIQLKVIATLIPFAAAFIQNLIPLDSSGGNVHITDYSLCPSQPGG